MNVRFANAPISWGVNEFDSANRIPPTKMLSELQKAGYEGTELGDWGYFVGENESYSLAKESSTFEKELVKRDLSCVGAFVTYSFWNREKHAEGRAYARKVAAALVKQVVKANINSSFPNHKPHLVLADNVVDPIRIQNTSKITPRMSLNNEKWKILVQEVMDLKKIIRDEYGLECYFHPHCGSFVETPWEIERLLLDIPSLSLIFDTAHITMGAASKPFYLIQLLNKFPKQIHSFHFKDYSPNADGKDYFELVNNGCFPELGLGICDFSGVRNWLKKTGYKGWIVVEQDILDNKNKDKPLQSAMKNMAYLKQLFEKGERVSLRNSKL